MSLINEALKEARHDAAQHDARRGGSLYPRVPKHGPRRRQRRVGWAAAGALLLVLSAVGAIAWLNLGEARPEAAVASDSGPETVDGAGQQGASSDPAALVEPAGSGVAQTAGRTAEPSTEPSTTPVDDPSAAASPPLEESSTPTSEAARPAASQPAAGASSTSATAGGKTTEVASTVDGESDRSGTSGDRDESVAPLSGTPAAIPSPPQQDDQAAEPRTYRREARLAGGVRLTLGGIAWSPTQPVALLNGRVIGIGERIEGYTLREVQRREVHLARGDEVVILQLE